MKPSQRKHSEEKKERKGYDEDEIEKEFQQFIEFTELQKMRERHDDTHDMKLPILQLSPSKIEEANRIFSKHKRFTLQPVIDLVGTPRFDDEDTSNRYINRKQSDWIKPRDEKLLNKQKKRHTKYKF